MNNGVKKIILSTVVAGVLVGCGGGSSSSGSSTSSGLSGSVIDGYIKNSRVFLDLDLDGQYTSSLEPSALTDEKGSYSISLTTVQRNHSNFNIAPLIAIGGIDTDTNQAFEGKLESPNSGANNNLTPMTTIVSKMVKSDTDNSKTIAEKIAEKKETLKKVLGVSSDVDISEDFISGENKELNKVALQIQKTVELISKALDDGSESQDVIQEKVVETLAKKVESLKNDNTATLTKVVDETTKDAEDNTSELSTALSGKVISTQVTNSIKTVSQNIDVAFEEIEKNKSTGESFSDIVEKVIIVVEEQTSKLEEEIETAIEEKRDISDIITTFDENSDILKKSKDDLRLVGILNELEILNISGDKEAIANALIEIEDPTIQFNNFYEVINSEFVSKYPNNPEYDEILNKINERKISQVFIPKVVVTQGGKIELSLSNTFSNIDGSENFTYEFENLASWVFNDVDEKELVFDDPSNSEVGESSFTITVKNGNNSIGSKKVFLEVLNINDAPLVSSEIVDTSINEDVNTLSMDIKPYFADIDANDELTFDVTLENGTLLPSWLGFSNGILTATPKNANVGKHNLKVTATDKKGAKASDTFILTVNNVNDVPTLKTSIADTAAEQNVEFNLDITGNFEDIDKSDTLTYRATLDGGVSLPSWLTFEDGVFIGTPGNADITSSALTVVVTAKDSSNIEVSDSFNLDVRDKNDAPIVSVRTITTTFKEDLETNINLNDYFSDIDANDSLSYSGKLIENGTEVELPSSWITINGNILSIIGQNNNVGNNKIKITASDKLGLSVSNIFDIEVINTNDSPTASDIPTQSAVEDVTSDINLSSYFNDIDVGDILTYDVTFANGDLLPNWMSFNKDTAILTVNANNEHVGNHSMKITAKDKSEESVVKEFMLAVTNINDKPLIEDIAINVVKNSNKSISLSATDVDNNSDDITFSIVSAPNSTKGTASVSGNTITFTPASDVIGEVTFTYKANDGSDDSDVKTITVNVLDVANVKDVLSTTVDWDEKEYFDLWKNLDSNTYADLTALDPSVITSIDTFEFENELMYGNSGEKRSLWIGKNQFTSTQEGFDWDKFSFEDGSFISDNDPILGVDKITLNENEMILNTEFKNYKVKYIGEIDASSFNDSTHNIFGNTSKAYALAINVIEDSYGFNEKVRDWSNHENEVYYTSIDGFITAHSNDSISFKQNENNPHVGLAFESTSSSSNKTGKLIEVDHINGVVNTDAGTWDIVTVNGRNILKITPSADGYDSDEDLNVYTEESGLLYKGWMDKAGSEFGTYFLDENAKDELVAYYDMIGSNIKKSEVIGKKMSVNGTSKTYYFRENDVLIGNGDSSIYSTTASYEELNDGTIKIIYINGEYDIIKKDNFEFSIVKNRYNEQGVIEPQSPIDIYSPSNYDTSSGSEYEEALNDNTPDTNLTIVDPYIKDAKLCYDANMNNQCDTNEPLSTSSNDGGQVTFSPGLEDGSKVIMLNSGIHNGQEFNGKLKAKIGASKVVSPTTTMIANGFDTSFLLSILQVAGINLSEDALLSDPMAGFNSNTAPSMDDYSKIQTAVAIHTFLAMTEYGLSPEVAFDSNNDLVEPYASLFPTVINVIKSAVNPDIVSRFPNEEQQYITPQVIVNVGVAISNYLVKQYKNGNTNVLTTTDFGHLIGGLGYSYGIPTNAGKHFMLDDNGFVFEVSNGFTSFGINWEILKPSDDERYNIDGNIAEKDSESDTIILNTSSVAEKDSRAGVRKYFDEAKSIVKAKVRFKEVNNKSRGQISAVMEDINDAGDRLYATITFVKTGAYAWIGKYNSAGDNSSEVVLLESTKIADLTTLSTDGAVKHTGKIEVIDNKIKFTVQKVDGTKKFGDDGYELDVSFSEEKELDTNFDLGIDRLELKAKTDLRNISELPSEMTRFRVHYVDVAAGNALSDATKSAISTLESLNLEVDDIDSTLANAKANLDAEITNNDTSDAKLAKTLIKLAEISNSDAVSNVLNITIPDNVSSVSYLNQIVRSTALDTIDMTLEDKDITGLFTYSDSQREVFHSLSSELKQISEDLKLLFTDGKTYAYDGDALTYKESIMLRSSVLAAAFKLEYLSAYKMGSDDDLEEKTEERNNDGFNYQYDYRNLNINPAATMNSGNFFKLEDESRVEQSKIYAIEALETALKLPVGYDDITAEDKADGQAILDSLKSSSTAYIIEPSNDDEIKSVSINLSTLYSSAGALRLSDFGSGWVNACPTGYTHSLEDSKIDDDIVCRNTNGSWKMGELEASTLPTTATSRIDEIINNITKKDSSNTVLTGQDMLDYLFEDDEDTSFSISGKQVVAADNAGSVTMKFHVNGNYEENGIDIDVTPEAPYSCTGKWLDLGDGKIAATCESGGTSAMPDGDLNTDDEIHMQLPTNFAINEVIDVKEWDSENNTEDTWQLTISSITNIQ